MMIENTLSARWLRLKQGVFRMSRFLLVGASGLVVNSLALAFWTEITHLHYMLGAALATQFSTLWNFGLTELWVFPDRHDRSGHLSRLVRFFVMNNVALALRGPLLYFLTSHVGIHYLVSNLVSLVLLTLIRYALANGWIWAGPRSTQ